MELNSSYEDVFNSELLDSKLVERNKLNFHLQNPNTVQNVIHKDVPKTMYTQKGSEKLHVSSLSGETIENFTHNNQVPFFRGSVTQNTLDSASSNVLERFTGRSSTFKSKTEVEPMFSRNEDNVFGTRVPSEAMRERFIASNYKQGIPLEIPVQVGPGLNKGFVADPSGGFSQSDAINYAKIPTVDELRVKTNPKKTYEGRVIKGNAISHREMKPNLAQNRVIRFHDWSTDRGNEEGFYSNNAPILTAPRAPDNFDAKETNRQTTKSFGIRNAGANNSRQKVKIITYSKERKNRDVEETTFDIANATQPTNGKVSQISDVIKKTKKQENVHDSRFGFTGLNSNTNIYTSQDDDPKYTGRHTLHSNYGGIAKSENTQTMSYGNIYNATVNHIKEKLVEERVPTKIGIKNIPETTKIGDIELSNEIENKRFNPIGSSHTNIKLDSNDIRVNFDINSYRDAENTRLRVDNLKPFNANPYTQSLNSSTALVG